MKDDISFILSFPTLTLSIELDRYKAKTRAISPDAIAITNKLLIKTLLKKLNFNNPALSQTNLKPKIHKYTPALEQDNSSEN